MLHKYLYVAGFFLISTNAIATSIEYCPSPGIVKNDGAYYSAEGGWVGQARSRGGKVTEFVGGIYQAQDGSKSAVGGSISRCAYKTKEGDEINLLYSLDEQKHEFLVRLENLESWKIGKGYFGSTIYECTSKQIGACAFSRL